jgi:hypothetical protein
MGCGCCVCSGACGILAETVYFYRPFGYNLTYDGDSFPDCVANYPLPEKITSTYRLGGNVGCYPPEFGCGCEVKYRFWRNLHSLCPGEGGHVGSDSDITTQTVVVTCTYGSVEVRLLPSTVYPLNSGDSHTFSSIAFDPAQGTVNTSTAGQCFSVAAITGAAAFTVEATLDWNYGTDHDLYGNIACGACT